MRVAHDPSLALATAITFRPQVAILDIGLPVMDGYALAHELRNLLGSETPALFALTGYGQERDRQMSEQAGFSAHLVKPVAVEELLALIEALNAGTD